ncbi:hypothetical protein DFH09DRAFT_1335176 [Mycena vulgaris]|nr:hypothetical protein DFH09DRAFT_1335176 [Mycena vulgaris]
MSARSILAPLLLVVLEAGLRLGYFPASWRIFLTVALRKPGKSDYSIPGAYRPIAEEECLGKVVESALTDWLSEFAESRGLLSPNQSEKWQAELTRNNPVEFGVFADRERRTFLLVRGGAFERYTMNRSAGVSASAVSRRNAGQQIEYGHLEGMNYLPGRAYTLRERTNEEQRVLM